MTLKISLAGALIALLLNAAVLTTTQARTGPRVGDSAPEFNLRALSGEPVTLSQLRQRGHVLLVFWAVECVYCYSHIKDFNALHSRYQGRGLTVAAINVAGEYDVQVAEYVKDNQLEYLVLSDRLNNIDVAEAYAVVGTPTLVMVSPAGKVVFYGHQIPDMSRWLN